SEQLKTYFTRQPQFSQCDGRHNRQNQEDHTREPKTLPPTQIYIEQTENQLILDDENQIPEKGQQQHHQQFTPFEFGEDVKILSEAANKWGFLQKVNKDPKFQVQCQQE